MRGALTVTREESRGFVFTHLTHFWHAADSRRVFNFRRFYIQAVHFMTI